MLLCSPIFCVVTESFFFLKRPSFPPSLEMSYDTLGCSAFRAWCSQCFANYWPRCLYSPASCVTAVLHKPEMQNCVCDPSQAHCDLRQLQTWCPKNSVNPVFLDSPFGCRCLTLDSTTNGATTPFTPESLEGASPLSKGFYGISAVAPCAMHIFRLPTSSFPASARSSFILRTIFTASFYSCYHKYNDSNTVLNHRMATILLYANRELTYAPSLAYSAARTLRAGGGTRNALLQRRFRSAISRSSFRVGPDVAPGIKCKYNRVRISGLYLASDFRTSLPPESRSLRPPATWNF